MKNIYLKAVLKAAAGVFSAALVFAACDDADKIYASTGELNGHEWVDLGLSVRWATCNVGASVPSEYGDYYAWGEIEIKSEYRKETSLTYGVELGDISGNPQYDAATANWGEGWRLPTKQELDELADKCVWTITTYDDVDGYKVTGPNGNSIFLPAAGYKISSTPQESTYGSFWGSTPTGGTIGAYALNYEVFDSSLYFEVGWFGREWGRSVRPVTDK